MNAFVFCICFIVALIAVTFAELPPYIKVCKRNDPEINQCITNSIDQLREKLTKGIPELDVPPIEPLLLGNLRLDRGPSSAKLDMNLTNLQVYGPSTFKITNLRVDVNKLIFAYTLNFAKLEFKGKYSIDARILLIQLNGDGNLNGHFCDYGGDVVMKAKKVRRNNKTYIFFDKMKLVIRVGSNHIELDNLFNGDKVLGKATNDILNENSDLMLQELMPLLENSLGSLFTSVANNITRFFTFEELFPSN